MVIQLSKELKRDLKYLDLNMIFVKLRLNVIFVKCLNMVFTATKKFKGILSGNL